MKCVNCNKSKSKLYTCEECNQKFCSNCGDTQREWCDTCLQFEQTQKDNESIDT
ncbi:MAG: hypothetical protein JW791_01680 [Nanoarchaeota archaeon]|nr:hypothetical protein [Nanoarchaeota archaeon]